MRAGLCASKATDLESGLMATDISGVAAGGTANVGVAIDVAVEVTAGVKVVADIAITVRRGCAGAAYQPTDTSTTTLTAMPSNVKPSQFLRTRSKPLECRRSSRILAGSDSSGSTAGACARNALTSA